MLSHDMEYIYIYYSYAKFTAMETRNKTFHCAYYKSVSLYSM